VLFLIFGAASLFITVMFRSNLRQWRIGFYGALLVGAVAGVVVYRAAMVAMARPSDWFGGLYAMASPLFGLAAALFAFPLIWGLAGLVMGIGRRPPWSVWLPNGIAVFGTAAVVAWVAYNVLQ
jgi:hypothetical protein